MEGCKMPDLNDQFNGAMFTIYQRAKAEAKYTATIFLNMLNARGGLATAKFLINAADESKGYTELYLRKRLDLTVEAMVVARRTDVRYLKGSWHETNRSPGFSIHTVVTREASGGEQGGACTREGGRGQVGGKRTKKKRGSPVEAKGTVNDTWRHAAIEPLRLPPWLRHRPWAR
jgi:hypothetical protein